MDEGRREKQRKCDILESKRKCFRRQGVVRWADGTTGSVAEPQQ